MATTPFIKLHTRRFTSPSCIVLKFWGVLLRLALLAGYPVILIGTTRTGKTLLLHKMTPGKVIDKSADVVRSGKQLHISDVEMPDDPFSLDECQWVAPASASWLMSEMAAARRGFCLAAQSYRDLKPLVNSYHAHKKAKRVFLVVVGGDFNPPILLNSLP